jgi:hypothetical protein
MFRKTVALKIRRNSSSKVLRGRFTRLDLLENGINGKGLIEAYNFGIINFLNISL